MIEIIKIQTRGNIDLINITEKIEKIIEKSKLKKGIVNVFTRHTTAGITIIEDEEGIKMDFRKAFEKFAPKDKEYNHNRMQNDDNAHSHICGSLIGCSACIPFCDKQLMLGTWQQIFLADFDTHAREREVVVSVN